jgi:hypothetical protein
MMADKKVADRNNDQSAYKVPCACEHNKPACKRSASFIPVDENYALGAGTQSWQILKRHRYKGGHRWEPIAWYPTLEQCGNALADQAVRTCGVQGLSEALAEAQRINSALCMALRPSFKVEVHRDG